ncbi:MAG TPA: MBOAT family protein [Candidatus Eisenbergiella stercoravium]|nr:MBOAT family protein [Candidatus Eisenbergiella stercoravium]
MLFNSYFFIFVFLPLSLAGWYLLNRLKRYKLAQGYLIGMSLWFYAWYNVSFLWVMLGSCLFNFGVSFFLSGRDTPRMRRFLLITGCVVNIGALGIFKYYNFFVENVNAVFGADFQTRNILLPLGISFFTFQQLSYLIDRCRGDAPHYGLMDYLSFVTFFPSLISGPIVLHASTVPQFQDETRRRFSAESFSRGVMQFSIGLAKKVLLADTLALAVNYGYENIAALDAPAALAAAVGYTLELYFDFSGYSDMAIGVGKMFRIEIPENFNSPYRATSVKDFWKRWHMTLSRFLQTYVYFPLGGSRKGKLRTFVNTMITFLVSGLWHGANWTFVFWGFLHGLGVAVAGIVGNRKASGEKNAGRKLQDKGIRNRALRLLCQLATFAYVCMAFVFFRADSIQDGFLLLSRIFSFHVDGQLVQMAAAMEPSEIYIVTKALSLIAPSLVGAAQIAAMIFMLAVSFFVLTRKNTVQIISRKEISFRFTMWLAFLFAWSVISLSGVSTFVYFSF